MVLDIYLKCLRKKGMSITPETVKALYSTNAILQRMGYIHSFKYDGARMWNSKSAKKQLDLSFRSAGSAQRFKDF